LALLSLSAASVTLAQTQVATSPSATQGATSSESPVNSTAVPKPVPDTPSDKQNQDKRIFGIIPNYRSAPLPNPYVSIGAKEKWSIALQDSIDRGAFALAALAATESFATVNSPSFGRGFPGYAHYFATSYADIAIGNFMTEAVFPVTFHQDPRYFAKLNGSKLSRVGYALEQLVVTHDDHGRRVFNISELGGNLTASAISVAYYPDNRSAGDVLSKWGFQIGIDAAGNVLKEFWPDIRRTLYQKKDKD
jgi:hypothetical protein